MKYSSKCQRAILFLVGPTAAGKTPLSLLLARRLGGEIVSADSMLVYRGMNIGTAKLSRELRRRIRHHLVDVVSPTQGFSVFQYRKKALRAIETICKRRKVPIVVGGSGLYIRSLIDGLTPQPAASPGMRKRYEQLVQRKGLPYLYRRLQRIDPKRAKEIHPHDRRRIMRALEVYDQSRQTPSAWSCRTQPIRQLGYRFIEFGLIKDRCVLYRDIEERVVKMMAAGWLDEAKRLGRRKLSRTARQAVGYRELLDFLKGNGMLEEAVARIQRDSRRLAKKQLTWFRRDPRIRWFHVQSEKDLKDVADKIVRIWKKSF